MVSTDTDKTEKPLTPVMEDYLMAIFDLGKVKRVVRVKNIVKKMKLKIPTVSSMFKTLNDRGMVNHGKHEYVEMTRSGASVGKEMSHRHEILHKFLAEILKVDRIVANEEACKAEHVLSPDTLECLTDFMAFIQARPRTGQSWFYYFEEFRRNGRVPEKCQDICQ